MVELGEAPAESGLENAKQSILVIEGLMFALNNANIPLRFAEQALKGAGFLQNLHSGLIKQIGPDEVEKMRQQYKTNIPPPPAPPPQPKLDA